MLSRKFGMFKRSFQSFATANIRPTIETIQSRFDNHRSSSLTKMYAAQKHLIKNGACEKSRAEAASVITELQKCKDPAQLNHLMSRTQTIVDKCTPKTEIDVLYARLR